MSKIKRFEVVRPEYRIEYIRPILGRLVLPIAMLKLLIMNTRLYKIQPTIRDQNGNIQKLCEPLYRLVIPKRVRKKV